MNALLRSKVFSMRRHHERASRFDAVFSPFFFRIPVTSFGPPPLNGTREFGLPVRRCVTVVEVNNEIAV